MDELLEETRECRTRKLFFISKLNGHESLSIFRMRNYGKQMLETALQKANHESSECLCFTKLFRFYIPMKCQK